MPSTIGTALRVTVWGQSHSAAIGCVVEGLPSGYRIDEEALALFMARRAPGQGAWTTPRKEADQVRILSGINQNGETCGAPLSLMIENTNTRSRDYDELRRVPRPGHADWTAQVKWGGHQDVAGGGHFSGRLTAPLCAAGGIAKQLLATRGVTIAAHLAEVAGVQDARFSDDPDELALQFDALSGAPFPVLDAEAGDAMLAEIEKARKDLDSVGGVVECAIVGLPTGIGSPLFDGIESTLARAIFGIPAVKGLEFGAGFAAARLRGSQNNDPYTIADGIVRPLTNHAGGNLGGITTGAPIVFRMAVKPTPSISQPQQSVDMIACEPTTLQVHGRHDPCIAPRAVPVAEAVAALAALDSWLAWPAEVDTSTRFL